MSKHDAQPGTSDRETAPAERSAAIDEPGLDGRVSAITPLASDPNQRRVDVDGRPVATLRSADVETLGLSTGDPWNEATADAVRRMTELARVRSDALRMLGRRGYARLGLRRRLTERGHAAALADTIVAELVDDGWVDDESFARVVAEETVRRQPAAPQLIVERLVARGVDAAMAQRIAEEMAGDPDGAMEAAMRLARTRIGAAGPTPAAVRRVGALLSRRGYDEDIIATVIDRLGLLTEEAGP